MLQLADDQPPGFESYPLSWVLRVEVNLVSISVLLTINQACHESLRKAAAHAYMGLFTIAASTNFSMCLLSITAPQLPFVRGCMCKTLMPVFVVIASD